VLVRGGNEPDRLHHALRCDGLAPIILFKNKVFSLLRSPREVVSIFDINGQLCLMWLVKIKGPRLWNRPEPGILCSSAWFDRKWMTAGWKSAGIPRIGHDPPRPYTCISHTDE
jgi:hypothetical protein